jgi:hypothetical protein
MMPEEKQVDVGAIKALVSDALETIFAAYQTADEIGDGLVYSLMALIEEHGREPVMAAVMTAMPEDWEADHHPISSLADLVRQVDDQIAADAKLEDETSRKPEGE